MKASRPDAPKPTVAELEILRVLWQQRPCTVREVHEALGQAGGYTTTLKLLQVMHSKGLVERDDTARAHVYRPAVTKERTQKRFLHDIVNRVFDGSSSQLVMHALGSQRATREELKEIRDLLNKLDQEER